MKEKNGFHMTADEFKRQGYAVVDWIADYFDRVENLPVLSQVAPGDIRRNLPAHAPKVGEPFEQILRDLDKTILPGITHWQSPNFYAYFPANTSGPSILGEFVSAALGVQGMLWSTSPACTELETHLLDWLVDMMALPSKFKSNTLGGGVIQESGSSATLCALLTARERALAFEGNVHGVKEKLIAYTSTQAHSSVEKAMMISGIGTDNIRLIEVDSNFAMRPDLLEEQIVRDKTNGAIPFFVCATVGTTSSHALDPLPALGQIAKRHGLWFHVDAAHAGTAALCPEYRFINDGLEFADSYFFNAHKWMFVNFDCSCFYVADRAALIKTFSILPEYLKNQATESGAVFDYRDWHVPLGRRFRALKLWFVIRHYGIEGLQYHIRDHIRLAKQLTQWIENEPQFEVVAPVPLSLVCFRHQLGDDFNQKLMDELNHSGKIYLTHTRLNGKLTLRFQVGQTQTQEHHVEAAWKLITSTANKLEQSWTSKVASK